MSVLKSKRGESTVQFLDTARELEIYTIKQCARFPKRFMFLITKEIVDLATRVYNNAKAANSIYVTTADDARLRRECITKANCALQCLISQLDIAREFIRTTDDNAPIKSKVWQTWLDLVTTEAKLLSALKNSDQTRYKKLTDGGDLS